jgi:hypothetical protein
MGDDISFGKKERKTIGWTPFQPNPSG